MGFVQRSFISIKKNLGKFGLLFVLISILGSLASGALSVQQAIHNTEDRLIAQIPAIANVIRDNEAIMANLLETGESISPAWNPPSLEMIEEIGLLPYVYTFNYRVSSILYSTTITIYINQNPNPNWGIDASEIIDWGSLSQGIPGGLERFNTIGVRQSDFFELETGFVEIVDGRTFTDSEIELGNPVVIISSGLATVNNLSVGSMINVSSMLFDTYWGGLDTEWLHIGGNRDEAGIIDTNYTLDSALVTKELEVEVIGIFEIVPQINADTAWQDVQWTQNALNQIYAPIVFVDSLNNFLSENGQALIDDFYVFDEGFTPTFLLNDPRDLVAFSEAANELLPRFWRIGDLSGNNDHVLTLITNLNWIADTILYTGVGATIIVLSLTILLFLKDRKHEIGIYLALGERKVRIMGQLLIEVFAVATLALSLALAIGNLLSTTISRAMLMSDFLHQEEEIPWIETTMPELAWHNPGEVTIEELLEIYDISLDPDIIIIFYALGSITVLLSTVIPMVYVLKLSPKKVLL